jgi:hypothetical protein
MKTEKPLKRACADCEQQLGILDRADQIKSHGLCRFHFLQLLVIAGKTVDEAWLEADALSLQAFCPCLIAGAKIPKVKQTNWRRQ